MVFEINLNEIGEMLCAYSHTDELPTYLLNACFLLRFFKKIDSVISRYSFLSILDII